MFKDLLSYLKKPKVRNIVILCVLLLVLVSIMTARLMTREIDMPGALTPVVCEKCLFSEVRRIDDIHSYACKKCGGPLSYIYKCGECGYVYPCSPPKFLAPAPGLSRQEKLTPLLEAQMCKNCKSLRTGAIPPSLYNDTKTVFEQEREKKQK